MNNFATHRAGRILIISSKVELDMLETTTQVIHCLATCKVTSYTFHVSFVYTSHTIFTHRPLWNNIVEFSLKVDLVWMIVGNFNNVLKIY